MRSYSDSWLVKVASVFPFRRSGSLAVRALCCPHGDRCLSAAVSEWLDPLLGGEKGVVAVASRCPLTRPPASPSCLFPDTCPHPLRLLPGARPKHPLTPVDLCSGPTHPWLRSALLPFRGFSLTPPPPRVQLCLFLLPCALCPGRPAAVEFFPLPGVSEGCHCAG